MLVLPTHPLGGSVMFSFSKSSWMDWATTATASLMWADSFFPLMSWSPIKPETTEKPVSLTRTKSASRDLFAIHKNWIKTYKPSILDILNESQTSAAWSIFTTCSPQLEKWVYILLFKRQQSEWVILLMLPPFTACVKSPLKLDFWHYKLRFGNQPRENALFVLGTNTKLALGVRLNQTTIQLQVSFLITTRSVNVGGGRNWT